MSSERAARALLAAAGLVLLVALLRLDWYSKTHAGETYTGNAWGGGEVTAVLANLVVFAGAAAALAVAATGRMPRLGAVLGAAAALAVALRMVFDPGGDGLDAPDGVAATDPGLADADRIALIRDGARAVIATGDLDLEPGIWIALAAALAAAAGAAALVRADRPQERPGSR